ncbi:MAG: carbamoyltransferase HypF, partial [Campylobacterota bacterium]|nr:carbamoyltransferase HypF [Campylobacterota bacterium]
LVWMMRILPLERSHLEVNRKIELTGVIQGVGFRPFVYQLADRYDLKGFVLNSSGGVSLEIEGREQSVEAFLESLRHELPPLAHIDTLECSEGIHRGYTDFQILKSKTEKEKYVLIPPDIATCNQCLDEMNDPANRRYRYPFINCTDCGPRYSIIETLPYDRPNTSMRFFRMCEACEAEYSDPANRRYHAQPISCWECGPGLSLWDSERLAFSIERLELIETAVQLIIEGNIVAVKGVGGYHLVCDATNDEAVQKMRERKRRPAKPYAVMVADMEMARKTAAISEQEEVLLTSKERPIVLLKTLNAQRLTLSAFVTPNLSTIGIFLPYTPLHFLLLDKLQRPLVATSANITDEPICTDRESLGKLSGVYDYILDHDREIVNGCDDSVVMVVKGQTVMLRRARGYAPSSIKLPFRLPKKILAVGANQKNTIAIGFNKEVILSPHIGDLDTIGSIAYFEKNIRTLERIYNFTPDIIRHDLHPNYESTKYAIHLNAQHSTLNTQSVQHHYAHILGVMAEKHLTGKVLGAAFDGTGYGDDKVNGVAGEGALGHRGLWGGEFLICDTQSYERVAHLDYFKLLGGDKAIKEPRRVALSLLFEQYGEATMQLDNPTTQAFTSAELKVHYQAWQKGINAPLSSSVGRLFDAVASLTGVCQVMSYEGESGMLLEDLYDKNAEGIYPFEIEDGKIYFLKMIEEIVLESDTKAAVSKFFHTLVEVIDTLYHQYDLPLVLSGGVFQNRLLLELILDRIPDAILPNEIPPNDGGIALGQVMFGAT